MTVDIANHDFTIQWGGVYYFTLSDYPRISAWELKKLVAFFNYEAAHKRETRIKCGDAGITTAIGEAFSNPDRYAEVRPPEKITECDYCAQRGCATKFLCHTATLDGAAKILESGRLLSAAKAFGRRADDFVSDWRNAAGDPADYFDYIMFSWGNCTAGDRLVMERKLGGPPGEGDLSERFEPGVRFYFYYEDLLNHPGYAFDGYHPAKIKDELVLENYLLACFAPEEFKDLLLGPASPVLKERIRFIPHRGLELREWTKKIYGALEESTKTVL